MSLLHLQASDRSLSRLAEQLAAVLHEEVRANPWAAAWAWCTGWWDFELTSTSDGKSVTLGSVVKGIFFLLVAVLFARLASREFAKHVLPRFGLNNGAVVAIQSMSFYVFFSLFSFEALQLAGLPLATFTFLGGAAAIGIGFGSQNVLNNFISGLILLAEQPIRVGDMVEIEGVRGTIEAIGARSTRMRTIANHEIMVPNSQLLQDKVTNMTLSDNLVRTCIEVKLSPTIPVDEITRRLKTAASSHPKVILNPEPVVLLLGFTSGDLTFELHFWIKMASLIESRQIESAVRTAICVALQDTDAQAAPAPPPAPAVAKDSTLPQPGLVAAAVALAVTQKADAAHERLAAPHAAEPARRKRADLGRRLCRARFLSGDNALPWPSRSSVEGAAFGRQDEVCRRRCRFSRSDASTPPSRRRMAPASDPNQQPHEHSLRLGRFGLLAAGRLADLWANARFWPVGLRRRRLRLRPSGNYRRPRRRGSPLGVYRRSLRRVVSAFAALAHARLPALWH